MRTAFAGNKARTDVKLSRFGIFDNNGPCACALAEVIANWDNIRRLNPMEALKYSNDRR